MKPIHNITFSFDEAEDRIVLRCTLNDKTPVALRLTRRLTGPLLEKLAKLLLKTSDMAASLPTQLREEVVMMEHAQALAQIAAQAQHPGAAMPETPREPPSGHLLTRIDFQPQPGGCVLLFFCNGGGDALAAIKFNRAQLHWFVDTLDRFATRAEWEIRPVQRGWLMLKDNENAAQREPASLH